MTATSPHVMHRSASRVIRRRARSDLAHFLLVRLAHLLEQLDRLAGLLLVDPLQGEADVDEHPVADPGLGAERDRDSAADTGDLGLREASARQSTISTICAGIPRHMSRLLLAATAAWP